MVGLVSPFVTTAYVADLPALRLLNLGLSDPGGGDLAWDFTFDQDIDPIASTFNQVQFYVDGQPEVFLSWFPDLLDAKVAHCITTWANFPGVSGEAVHLKSDGDIKSVAGVDCNDFDESAPTPP